MQKSILEPPFIKEWRIENFQKTIRERFLENHDDNLRRGNFEELDREALFAIVKENSVKGAEDVFFWAMEGNDAYFIFVGFGVERALIDCEGGFLLLISEKLSDDVFSLFKDSSAIKLDMEDLDHPENYTGNPLADLMNLAFGNPRSLEEREREQEEMDKELKLCNKFRNYVLEMPKENILVGAVKKLDVETLLSKLRANKPKDAQTVHFWKNIEEDWYDLQNVKYETFLYAGYSDGENIIGNVIAFRVQSLDDDVWALIDYYGDKHRPVLKPVEVLTEPLSKFIDEDDDDDDKKHNDRKNAKENNKAFVGKKINYERYVNLMPQEKIHFVDAEGYDVKKFFTILKSIKPKGAKLIHFLKKIEGDFSIIYVGFGDEGQIMGDLTAFKAKTFFWDVNAMFERDENPGSPIIEKVGVLFSVRNYIMRLPWHNRPRNTYDIVKNK